MYKAEVFVTLKNGILDPQGNAVLRGLESLDIEGVKDVRVGKYLEVSFEADNRELAEKKIELMSSKLLANMVIEDYRFTLTEV